MSRNKNHSSEFDILVVPPTKVVSIKLDVATIEMLDEIWQRYGFRSRSDFIRTAIIFFITVLEKLNAASEEDKVKKQIFALDELNEILDKLSVDA